MILSSPSRLRLPEETDKVKRFLSFTDRSVSFQINKMRQMYHWKRNDPDGFETRLEELKASQKKSILMHDEDGLPYTYSGLWQDLRQQFGWELTNGLVLPEANRSIPWAHIPEFEARYYQEEAVLALLANAKYGPCAIELPTGSGKSRIIHELCHRNPVQTVIITPSKTITSALFRELTFLMGPKFVGKYGDGRKDLGKLFTVATAQALTRIEKGSDEDDFFKKTAQFVWDESHTTPAETFEKVCLGVLGDVPYRFFLSATQMRTDGSELMLRGITGPVVYSKDFKELVNEGFLARPIFKLFHVPAYGFSGSKDAKKETRTQLYQNPNVNSLAAEFAEKCVNLANRQTVILIEEFQQFLTLKNYIKVPFEFAHGGSSNRENSDGVKLREVLPKEYWESDVDRIVERFNRGDTKLIIGTSAIGTGVDLKPTGALIYLQGGLSEIKVKQAIGRGTRVTDTKKDCIVVDFNILGSPTMERHYEERKAIYASLGDVTEIRK